jgi:glycolate oxidase FAD binding subunit
LLRKRRGCLLSRRLLMNPCTPAELADAVRATPRVLAVGARTKPRLAQVGEDVTLLSTRGLSGIVEYDPSEFTFTALAGTPLREIMAALAERGQYLPFDPPLAEAGATLGGTVAAGLSGPGRFRYGGLRDFILGVRFVDGSGRLLRLGGKVVKNAAGFDVPKFLVGSLGRFGVLAEMTFKVFPCPPATLTVRVPVPGIAAAQPIVIAAANTRWEIDALDVSSSTNAVFMRLRAPQPALETLAQEILARWPGSVLTAGEAAAFWSEVLEFRWAKPTDILAKFALTPNQMPALDGVNCHVSAGGNLAYATLPNAAAAEELATCLGCRGLTLRGDAPLWLGPQRESALPADIKTALDPQNRFPSLAA